MGFRCSWPSCFTSLIRRRCLTLVRLLDFGLLEGRTRIIFVSREREKKLSKEAYSMFLLQNKGKVLPQDNRVGVRER